MEYEGANLMNPLSSVDDDGISLFSTFFFLVHFEKRTNAKFGSK